MKTTNYQINRSLQEFFGPLGDKYAASLARAVESAESCIDRRDRHAGDLREFLKPYSL